MKIIDKNGKEVEVDLKDWKDIIKAVRIIKRFGIDVQFFKKLLLIIQNRIDEEKKERKEEDKKIKNNYLNRFDKLEEKMDKVDNGINTKIKDIDEKFDDFISYNNKEKIDAIKRTNKNLWIFLFAILGSTLILFVTMIWDKIFLFLGQFF
jgi:hypothetical protein